MRGFFSTLFGRRRADAAIDAELQYHIEARIDALTAQGLSPGAARRQARLEFGGQASIAEACRDSRPARWFHDLLQDLEYAWRMMKKSPVVSAAAVLSLALGIGANTAIFSLMDALLLRELPVERPGELVAINWHAKRVRMRGGERLFGPYSGSIHADGTGDSFSYAAFAALRERTDEFAQVAAHLEVDGFSVAARGTTHAVKGQFVTGDYFTMLGIRPELGRLLQRADDAADAPVVAVVSHRFWQRALAGDREQIGRAIRINNVAAIVVGVTGPGFFGHQVGAHPDVYVSLARVSALDPQFTLRENPFTMRSVWVFHILARVRDPGVALGQLEARLTPVLLGTLDPMPKNAEILPRLVMQPAARGISGLRRGMSTTFGILLGSTMLVLLIAAANVANLLLARAMGRQREIAVRLSMGASRGRLWRQIVSEFLLLAGIGAAVSLLVALVVPDWLVALFPSRGELVLMTGMNWHVLLATSTVALAITFLFGAIPAWQATRLNVTGALKENAGSLRAGTGQRPARGRIGKLMIAGQVALSLLLLAGAGMFVRTLVNLQSEEMGFARGRIALFTLNAAQVGYGDEQRAPFFARVVAELEAVPGVESVSASQNRPLTGGGYWDDVNLPVPNAAGRKNIGVGVHFGLPHYATTMGVRLIAGRDIDERDGPGSPRVMVVNETLAREAFGGRNPVGEMVTFGDHTPVPYRIVGLVGDAKYDRVRRRVPVMYAASLQQERMAGQLTFAVRTRIPPGMLMPSLRAAVAKVEANIPLDQFRTLEEQIDDSLRAERLFATLCGVFAVLALVLAAVGIFGVMAYQAGRRRQEIGVRLALGAGRDRVVRMVLRESVLMVILGICAGLPLAYFLPRLVDSFLFGLQASDPGQFIGATAVLLLTAVAAAWIPAWRAARLDPMTALREE
jgi:macrolide transport system ATP-binding/permease protein